MSTCAVAYYQLYSCGLWFFCCTKCYFKPAAKQVIVDQIEIIHLCLHFENKWRALH